MLKKVIHFLRSISYAEYFIVSSIIICFATLLGWILNIQFLKDFDYTNIWMNMVPITALVVIICALALFFIIKERVTALAIFLSVLPIFFGIIALINNFSTTDLFSKHVIPSKLDSIFIPPLVAIQFICIGAALFLLSFNKKKDQLVVEILTSITFLFSSTVFLDYTYSVGFFQKEVHFFTIPYQFALCFLLISLAILISGKHKILLSIFLENNDYSKIGRKQILVILFLFLLIGFIRIQGQRAGYFGPEVGTSLITILSFIILFFIFRSGLFEIKKKEDEKNLEFVQKIETEINLKTTLDRIAQGFMTLNKAYKITYINKTVSELVNKSPDELLHKNMWAEFPEVMGHQFQLDCFEADSKQVYITNKSYYAPYDKWFDYDIYPSQNGLSIFFRDVTERYEFENQIKKSNERFILISKATYEALWESNLETGALWANEMHQELFGLTTNDPVPKEEEWISRIHPEDRLKVVEQHNKSFTSTETIFSYEYRFLTNKNEYVYIYDRVYFLRDESGKPLCIMGSMMNVNDLKKVEQQLEANKKHLQAILDNAPQCIKILNEQGELLEMNKRGIEIIEASNIEEIKALPLLNIIKQEYRESFKNLIDAVFQNKPGQLQFQIITLKGNIIWLESHAVPILDKQGKVVTLLAVTNDITDRKKQEVELQESYASVRKLTEHLQNIREEERTFISRELHDELGQQLAAMKMDLAWVNKRLKESEEPIKDKIKFLMGQISLLIKSVRKISFDLRPSSLSDFGLAAAMEQYLKDFEERSGIHVNFKMPIVNPELNDSIKTTLYRIFQECLTNISRHAQAKNVFIELNFFGKKVLLLIKDDGVGFNNDILKTKKTLGIIGMKERVVILNGEFEIQSEPNKGTTTKIVIPFFET